MLDGKTTTLAGVVAKGRTLTLRLTRRAPDFLRSARQPLRRASDACPSIRRECQAPLHSAAPYYVAAVRAR